MIVLSWMLLLFGGGATLPIGVPLPPDAGLQGAAPPNAIIYAAHAGSGAPDPNSKNQVELMLAEPEVQGFLVEVERLINEGVKRIPTNTEEERVLASTLPVIGKTLLTRPSMLYVSDVKVPPQAPSANAALIVAAGAEVGKLTAALEEIEALIVKNFPPGQTVEKSEVGGAKLRKLPMPPGLPPVVWGVKGEYVFIAVGEKEAETVVERLTARGPPPEWLVKLQEELDIKRTTALVYVNAETIIARAEPVLKQFAQLPPPLDDISKLLDLSGLRSLKHVAVGAGLGETTAVSKVLIRHDGKPQGFLNFGEAKPLSAADFKLIPRNADLAFVGRFDTSRLHTALFDLVEKINPEAKTKVEAEIGRIEEQLGFSIQKDLLAGLGDTWTLYNSSEEGGLLGTGLCASVGVRDRAKVEKVIDSALRVLEEELQRDDKSAFSIRKTEVGGKTIQYIQVTGEIFPVSPAWCFVDDRLVIAMSPQMVRASISRPADEGSLADVPEVAEHLKTGDVTSLSYSETTLLLRFAYSYAQYIVTLGASALEKELGIKTDISKFPSLGSIRRHMRPSVSVTRQTKTGIIFESYATGPSIDAVAVPAIAAFIGGFGYQAIAQARDTARAAESMKNMRQVCAAILAYEADKGSLPPRVLKGPDGTPLLSWRVAILPYMEEKALYDQFHRDEPWDSVHNRTLLKLMPRAFAHPSAGSRPGSSLTQYQIPTGKGTLYDTDFPPKLTDPTGFPDGTTGTILLVEADAEHATSWTKPEDVEFSREDPDEISLHRWRDYNSVIGFADGSLSKRYAFGIWSVREALFPRIREQ